MASRRLNRQRMEDQGHRIWLSPGDLELRTRILDAIPATIRAEGFASVSFSLVADGFGITPHHLRKIFADRDELLFKILRGYQDELLKAFSTVRQRDQKHTPAERQRKLRAIYWHHAHEGVHDFFSTRHAILLREARMLPPDLQQRVQDLGDEIAAIVEPNERVRAVVMNLLDSPCLPLADIERVLTGGLAVVAASAAEDPWPPRPGFPEVPPHDITWPRTAPEAAETAARRAALLLAAPAADPTTAQNSQTHRARAGP